MPFAPTILDSWASRYLENYDPARVLAPHMITAFRATPLGLKHLRAAMHQGDFTIRAQVLDYRLIPNTTDCCKYLKVLLVWAGL